MGGAKTQNCTAFGTTGALQCIDAATAAPTKKESELLFAETRMLFQSLNIAVSPRVEFDLDATDCAIEVSIYLARNKE